MNLALPLPPAVAARVLARAMLRVAYSESQERDDSGRWTEGGSRTDAAGNKLSDIRSELGRQTVSGPNQLERWSLRRYTETGSRPMNRMLRSGGTQSLVQHSTAGSYDEVAQLDNLIARNTLHDEAEVYRTVTTRSGLLSLNVGDTFTDKGFISTTKSRAVAEHIKGFTAGKPRDPSEAHVLTIRTPAGQKGFDTTRFDDNEEEEVLLPRGLTFEVTHVKDGRVSGLRVRR